MRSTPSRHLTARARSLERRVIGASSNVLVRRRKAACGKCHNALCRKDYRVLKWSSMGQPQFVHLHVHTDYSLLDGACETSELLDEASRQKMPAVAITDHGNLFAAANFFSAPTNPHVNPITASELYMPNTH